MRIGALVRVLAALAIGLGGGPALAQAVVASIPAGAGARAIALNPATNRIYVANEFSNSVTVVDGATHAVSTVAVGVRPQYITVNGVTNRIYVSNGTTSTQSVIDGATHAVTTLPTGSNGPMAVNPVTNKIYVVRLGDADEVMVIDGATHSYYAMAIDSYTPVALAVDTGANRLYVANYTTGDVRSVDLSSTSDFPPTRSIPVWGRPVALGFDAGARRIYVIGEDARGPINVIDAGTYAAVSFAPPGHAQGPRAIAVNPTTGKAYAAFNGEVVVIDGASGSLAFVPTGNAVGIAINPSTQKVYVPDAQGSMAVIDAATNAVKHVAIPRGATAIAINAATNRIYLAGAEISVLDGAAAGPPVQPPAALNVQGLWWRSPAGSESGWGVNLTQQGEVLFATWFTYDVDGSGMWLVMSNGTSIGPNAYRGKLYRTTGPAFSGVFDPARIVTTEVGTASFSFSDASNGTFAYTVNGVSASKPITRQVFAAPVPSCAAGAAAGAAPNYQALWWRSPAGSESGWGVNLTHQGDNLFVTWFTYGADGRGMWLVGSNVARTGNATYAGPLYRTWGPPFHLEPWSSARVTTMPVGNISFAFSDASNGVMTYTVEGVTQSKPVTRQVYATPVTVCR